MHCFPRSFQNPVLFGLTGAFCCTSILSGAQLDNSLKESRLSGKFDRRAVDSFGERGQQTQEGVDLSVVASMAYDDNIFQSPTDEEGDLVVQVEPAVAWVAGQKEKGNWVRLAYEGAAVLYLSESDGNRFDHRFSADGAFRKKNLVLAYSGSWAKLGSPSADVGGTTDRNDWGVRVNAIYQPKGKWSYSVFAERSAVDQDEAQLFDIWETAGGVAATFVYSPKTQVEVAYRLGEVEVDGSGRQTYHRLSSQILWRPRPKISLSLEGGAEFRDYVSGSRWGPFLSARADWTPRRNTAFYLEAYHREEASAALAGENFELSGFRFGVTQRLRGGWSAGLEVGREVADYFAIAGGVASGREDEILFVRPTVAYEFGDGSQILFLYQWSQNDSTTPEFGYDNQQIGVSVNYNF